MQEKMKVFEDKMEKSYDALLNEFSVHPCRTRESACIR
mgnify:CR=1 FL=1